MKEVKYVERDAAIFRIEDKLCETVAWGLALAAFFGFISVLNDVELLGKADVNGLYSLILVSKVVFYLGVLLKVVFDLTSNEEETKEKLLRKVRVFIAIVALIVEIVFVAIFYVVKGIIWTTIKVIQECKGHADKRLTAYLKEEGRRKEIKDIFEAEELMETFYKDDEDEELADDIYE